MKKIFKIIEQKILLIPCHALMVIFLSFLLLTDATAYENIFPKNDSVFPGNGPYQKAPWFQEKWSQRRTQFLKNKKADMGSVVFVGDSITEEWNNLEKYFPGLKVANRGISGDCTRGVLYRLEKDVLELRPSAIVILIGINDIQLGGNPDVISENMRLLISKIKRTNRSAPIIVCRVLPAGHHIEEIRKLNERVDKIVRGDRQLIRCDTWSIFADRNGQCRKTEFPDMLHPNPAGYEKLADVLRPIFVKLNLYGRGK